VSKEYSYNAIPTDDDRCWLVYGTWWLSKAHLFLERRGETLTVVKLREYLRDIDLVCGRERQVDMSNKATTGFTDEPIACVCVCVWW
jgi:hypothetical protein